jgi:hypothetical protein
VTFEAKRVVERTKSLIQQVMIKTIKGYSHENRAQYINTIGNWIFCSGESWSASSATAASEEWREGEEYWVRAGKSGGESIEHANTAAASQIR